MALRLLLFSALTLVVLPAAVRAQAVPDTTSPTRYYPLNVGDQWQYEVEVEYFQYCIPCRYQEVRDVTGTTEVNGQTYAVVRTRTFNVPAMPSPPPATSTAYVRFDPAAAIAVTSSGQPVDPTACRLDEAFPASPSTPREISCPGSPSSPPPTMSTVSGGYEAEGFRAYKRFDFMGIIGQVTAYAADLGLVLDARTADLNGTTWRLRYARVNGTPWGTPVVIFTDAEAGSVPTALAVRVSPNPVGAQARLSVAVPTAGPLVVVVTDALGREVSRTAAAVDAGTHAVALDAASWAAGVYVVRVTNGAGATATRVVVRV